MVGDRARHNGIPQCVSQRSKGALKQKENQGCSGRCCKKVPGLFQFLSLA